MTKSWAYNTYSDSVDEVVAKAKANKADVVAMVLPSELGIGDEPWDTVEANLVSAAKLLGNKEPVVKMDQPHLDFVLLYTELN